MWPFRIIAITLSIGLLATRSLAEDQRRSEDQPNAMSYLDGLAMGRALAGYYASENKEKFVGGLIEGLKNSSLSATSDERMREAKLSWFNDSGLSLKEQSSYSYGYLLGDTHKREDGSLSPFLVAQGYLDSLQNEGLAYVSREQGTNIVTRFQRGQYYSQKKVVADRIRENESAGQIFLSANATRPGVTESPSGLQFRILKAGQGASPKEEDTVVVSIVATKVDGQVFYDSESDGQGKPITIKLNKALNGWQEALVKMSRGAEWELVLPAKLAYGNAGWQSLVEPGEVLIYRLTLIDFSSEP